MSSRKTAGRRGTTKKRAQRATSNVFAMFNQDQIQEFKEAFNMIDQNRDGFIDKEDLHDMLASLGKNPTDEYLEGMMNEAPGPINFTMFLTLFGERLQGTDPEDVIKNAFGCFDDENTGVIHEDRLRELLTTIGDRFTDEEVDEMYREAPIKNGLFDVRLKLLFKPILIGLFAVCGVHAHLEARRQGQGRPRVKEVRGKKTTEGRKKLHQTIAFVHFSASLK